MIDAQRAFAADEDLLQIVAGIVLVQGAQHRQHRARPPAPLPAPAPAPASCHSAAHGCRRHWWRYCRRWCSCLPRPGSAGTADSCSSAARCTSARVTPASTVRVMPLSSTPRIRFSRLVESSTSPCSGIWPPTRPVLPPWVHDGVPVSLQMAQDGGDFGRGGGLQQQRRVAVIFAAPFFQMRRDLGGVVGKALRRRRPLSAGRKTVVAARSSRRGRPAQPVVDGLADAVCREWATRRSRVGALVQLPQHGEEIGGGFPQIAARATGSAWRPAHRRSPAALRRIRSRSHSGARRARGA